MTSFSPPPSRRTTIDYASPDAQGSVPSEQAAPSSPSEQVRSDDLSHDNEDASSHNLRNQESSKLSDDDKTNAIGVALVSLFSLFIQIQLFQLGNYILDTFPILGVVYFILWGTLAITMFMFNNWLDSQKLDGMLDKLNSNLEETNGMLDEMNGNLDTTNALARETNDNLAALTRDWRHSTGTTLRNFRISKKGSNHEVDVVMEISDTVTLRDLYNHKSLRSLHRWGPEHLEALQSGKKDVHLWFPSNASDHPFLCVRAKTEDLGDHKLAYLFSGLIPIDFQHPVVMTIGLKNVEAESSV